MKRLKQAIKQYILFIIVGSVFMSLPGCQKEAKENITEDFIMAAKNWFSNSVLAEETKILSKPFTELPKDSPKRVLSRMNKLSKKLNWVSAKYKASNRLEYIVVPLLKDELKLENNHFVERYFLFYRNSDGSIDLDVIELLAKNKQPNNGVDIAAKAFENKFLKKSNSIQSEDLSVFFYDKKYSPSVAYKIKNNNWISSQTYCISKNNINSGHLRIETEGGDCTLWGVFYVEYDINGNVLYSELLYTYWVGDCGNGPGDNPNEEMPEPTGGGEEGEGYEIFRTLTWHVYNTLGGSTQPSGVGYGVNSMENVRGKRNSSLPNGGYFTFASHYTSTCNDCNDPTDPSAAYGETTSSVSYTDEQVSSSVSGSYSENGVLKNISGSRTWTFGQIF